MSITLLDIGVKACLSIRNMFARKKLAAKSDYAFAD